MLTGSIIAPDMTVIKAPKVFFVEVKRKTRWIHWCGKTETGLNQRHYNEYKRIAEATGLPVLLIFIHEGERPHGIYVTTVANAPDRIWNGKTPDGRYVTQPEVFFLSESLKRIN